jgi:TolB-like protein
VRLAVMLAVLFVAVAAPSGAQDYQPALNDVIASLDKAMARGALKNMAILGVTDLTGRPTCLGDLLTEELSVGLAGGDRSYQIVSRNDAKLKAALSEQRLGRSGLIDPESAAHVGQLLGVQALAMGTVTPVGDNIRLTISLIDAGTARIVGGAAATFPRTKAIEDYVANCGTPASTSGALDAGQPGPKLRVTTVEGFEFELEACRRSGGAVTCAFWLTNRREDRNFFIGSGVGVVGFSAWDDRGNSYTGRRVQVANKTIDALGTKLIGGIRTRLLLSLEGAVAGDSLTRLEFSASGSDVGFFRVVLANLPIINVR